MAGRVASRVAADPRRLIAELIEDGLAPTAMVRQLSRAWGIAERTLWRLYAEYRAARTGGRGGEGVTQSGGRGPGRKPGPRPVPQEVEVVVDELVIEVLKDKGWKAGERTVFDALKEALPLRLVRRSLKRLKAARRRRIEAAKLARRFSFAALAEGVLWCLDEAQLAAKQKRRAPVFVQLNRDPATRRTSASELSPPATGEAAIAWVKAEVRYNRKLCSRMI